MVGRVLPCFQLVKVDGSTLDSLNIADIVRPFAFATVSMSSAVKGLCIIRNIVNYFTFVK